MAATRDLLLLAGGVLAGLGLGRCVARWYRSTTPKRSCRVCKCEAVQAPSPTVSNVTTQSSTRDPQRVSVNHSLNNEQIARYGRHLILPECGVEVQARICNASVLVIGAGGLGAPVCLYLAAAGVGRLGIVDGDAVEKDNLHRQVIHTEHSLGLPKALSARDACTSLNSSIKVDAWVTQFDSSNAMDIAGGFDVLVDCTDNVASRYLINDTGVLLGIPIVSAGALRTEGQVTVYHYEGGPCYRCLFPEPPPPETVTNCSDGGVLGVVPGLVGCIQALQVIKLIGKMHGSLLSQKMLLVDAVEDRYLCMKLRARKPDCAVCGDHPTVTRLVDYQVFCRSLMHDKVLETDARRGDCPATDGQLPLHVSVNDYHQVRKQHQPHILLDVREPVQFQICALPGAVNVPLRQLLKEKGAMAAEEKAQLSASSPPVYVLCRRGIDSVVASELLRSQGIAAGHVFNVAGGLEKWAKLVDPSFPTY